MKGYDIRKVYVIICDKCNEDITRAQSGEEPTTRADADEWIRDHERTWHAVTTATLPNRQKEG